MKNTTKSTGMKVTTGLNAGGLWQNHNRTALKVRSAIKAGGLWSNHNRAALAIK